jgi:cytochrome P450
VTDRTVIDFDHHSPHFAENWMDVWNTARGKCPVAWTDSNDGHWVLSGYDQVAEVSRDDETFSSFNDVEQNGARGNGILIPRGEVRFGIIEQDPPECREMRKIVQPWFTPRAIEKLKPTVEQYTREAVDAVIESGSCDLVEDIAALVPAKATLKLLGLPMDEAEKYGECFHKYLYVGQDKPEFARVMELMGWVMTEMITAVADRRANPTDDMISMLTKAEVAGEPLTDQAIFEVILLFLGGGLDTTTSLTANALVWLDENPEARKGLLDPKAMELATEEFLRYYSPIQALGRTVKTPVEIGGVKFETGDKVLMGWAGANHDPAVFDNPGELILDRFPNRHTAFGLGAHRCLGSTFARSEFQVMMTEILTRMPDYKLDRSKLEHYPDISTANGYISLPATFTPGKHSSDA